MRSVYSVLILLPVVCDPGVVAQRPVQPMAKTGELVVLTRNSATTRYIDSQGRYTGLEYDLVEMFARELGVRVRYLDRQPFYQVLPGLEENHAHLAAAGVSITSARLGQFLFGPAPLLLNRFELHLPLGQRLGNIFLRRGQPVEVRGGGLLLARDTQAFPLDPGQVFVHLRELVLQSRRFTQ